jgi:hypothetical protein
MRVLVKLFHTITPASDRSIIPRKVVEEYLQSDEYKNSIERGLMIGSISHADRVLTSRPGGDLLKGVVGKDDAILLNHTGVSVIEKIFLPDDPNDEWVYAIMRFFDENSMDNKSAECIKQIKGLIKNGVKLSTSSIVLAYWNDTGNGDICEKLISVKGNDITLNPAFSKNGKDMAGVVKILDE